jgi:hypothetical protein
MLQSVFTYVDTHGKRLYIIETVHKETLQRRFVKAAL